MEMRFDQTRPLMRDITEVISVLSEKKNWCWMKQKPSTRFSSKEILIFIQIAPAWRVPVAIFVSRGPCEYKRNAGHPCVKQHFCISNSRCVRLAAHSVSYSYAVSSHTGSEGERERERKHGGRRDHPPAWNTEQSCTVRLRERSRCMATCCCCHRRYPRNSRFARQAKHCRPEADGEGS